MKKIFLILLLSITLVGCEQTTTITYPEMSYLSFNDSYLNNRNEQLAQEEDTYYIYFYQQQCGACSNIKNEALYTIEFLKTDTVYFCEILSLSDLHDDIYVLAQSYGNEFGTPFIVKIENGELIEMSIGGSSVLNVLHGLS